MALADSYLPKVSLIIQLVSPYREINAFILQVKTQQGVPSQPSNFRVVETRATSITLEWNQPSHSGDNIVSYELYWNDTFSGDVSKLRCLGFSGGN